MLEKVNAWIRMYPTEKRRYFPIWKICLASATLRASLLVSYRSKAPLCNGIVRLPHIRKVNCYRSTQTVWMKWSNTKLAITPLLPVWQSRGTLRSWIAMNQYKSNSLALRVTKGVFSLYNTCYTRLASSSSKMYLHLTLENRFSRGFTRLHFSLITKCCVQWIRR